MVNYEFGKCFCATEDEAVPQSYDLRKPRLLVYWTEGNRFQLLMSKWVEIFPKGSIYNGVEIFFEATQINNGLKSFLKGNLHWVEIVYKVTQIIGVTLELKDWLMISVIL